MVNLAPVPGGGVSFGPVLPAEPAAAAEEVKPKATPKRKPKAAPKEE